MTAQCSEWGKMYTQCSECSQCTPSARSVQNVRPVLGVFKKYAQCSEGDKMYAQCSEGDKMYAQYSEGDKMYAQCSECSKCTPSARSVQNVCPVLGVFKMYAQCSEGYKMYAYLTFIGPLLSFVVYTGSVTFSKNDISASTLKKSNQIDALRVHYDLCTLWRGQIAPRYRPVMTRRP
ncbi:hypothetical protein BgiMline_023740 [Biomphalaria glabrata]|nr:hypothetical protein BgiMline_006986 [Biomphalaria glabrata]